MIALLAEQPEPLDALIGISKILCLVLFVILITMYVIWYSNRKEP